MNQNERFEVIEDIQNIQLRQKDRQKLDDTRASVEVFKKIPQYEAQEVYLADVNLKTMVC